MKRDGDLLACQHPDARLMAGHESLDVRNGVRERPDLRIMMLGGIGHVRTVIIHMSMANGDDLQIGTRRAVPAMTVNRHRQHHKRDEYSKKSPQRIRPVSGQHRSILQLAFNR